jgi:trans-aconitate methyltransferase
MHTFMERLKERRGMGLRPATDLFSEWADNGKDEGMERGHAASVDAMLGLLLNDWDQPFTALDLGCGNGWVVRRMAQHPQCTRAIGVDGAPSMIQKARSVDPSGEYIEAMLPEWIPDEPVNLIHTMEVLYYLQDPLSFLRTVHDSWLLPGGRIVIGVDHYEENPASHDWGPSLNVHMTTLSIDAWAKGLTEARFVEIEWAQVGAKEGWSGTLVLTAHRP